MLGIDSLQSRRVTIDFKKDEMRVMPVAAHRGLRPDTIVVKARSRFGQLILVDARFLGERVKRDRRHRRADQHRQSWRCSTACSERKKIGALQASNA